MSRWLLGLMTIGDAALRSGLDLDVVIAAVRSGQLRTMPSALGALVRVDDVLVLANELKDAPPAPQDPPLPSRPHRGEAAPLARLGWVTEL